MKKLILLIILILICCGVYIMNTKKAQETENNDLEIIQQVDEACEKIAQSQEVYSLGDAATWHVFDLEFMYQKEGECYEALADILGEDFSTILSNGDRLFVGFLPFRQSYRIYAGDPRNDNNMIYPDWKYTKVSPENN